MSDEAFKIAPGPWTLNFTVEGKTHQIFKGSREEVRKRFDYHSTCIIKGSLLEEIDAEGKVSRRLEK